MTIANARETNQLLMNARVDLAIVCEPIGHNDYTYRPFYAVRRDAVVPATSPLANADVFEMGWLADQRFLLRERLSRTRAATERLFDAHGAAPRRIMEFQTSEMIRKAAARDLGMSFMFERECRPDARLATLPIASDDPATRIAGYVACRTKRRRHPAIRVALDRGAVC